MANRTPGKIQAGQWDFNRLTNGKSGIWDNEDKPVAEVYTQEHAETICRIVNRFDDLKKENGELKEKMRNAIEVLGFGHGIKTQINVCPKCRVVCEMMELLNG